MSDTQTQNDFILEGDTLVAYTGAEAAPRIPAGIKRIGEKAFFENAHIREIQLPTGVESVEKQAFAGSALVRAALPVELSYLAEGAFANCKDLQEVMLESDVLRAGQGVFAGCPEKLLVKASHLTAEQVRVLRFGLKGQLG